MIVAGNKISLFVRHVDIARQIKKKEIKSTSVVIEKLLP